MINQMECIKELEKLADKFVSFDDFAESISHQIIIIKQKMSLLKEIIQQYWDLLYVNAIEKNSSMREQILFALRKYEDGFFKLVDELHETEKMAESKESQMEIN